MSLQLASYNIQYGTGKDDIVDLDRIAHELGRPDLIALQEVERNNARRGGVDQVAEFAQRFDHMHYAFGPGIDVDASPPGAAKPLHLRHQFGNMVLSRWPILSVVNHPLPKIALRRMFHLQRSLVEAIIDTPQGPLRFCSVHLDHVSTMTRMPQVEVMIELLTRAEDRGASWGGELKSDDWMDRPAPACPRGGVVMGDMNFEPSGPEYARIVGDQSNWDGRAMRANGLVDAWVEAGNAEADGNTLPRAGRPAMRIDHCFVTANLADGIRSMRIDETAQGSDHQPIFVELDLAAV